MTWTWGPKLLDLYEREGFGWTVVDSIPPETFGSSPGDVVYDGERVIIEKACPQAWVAHELAHYLVCRRDNPELLGQANYGFDAAESSVRDDNNDWYNEGEGRACVVTVALLSLMGYPWHYCAHDLGVRSTFWPEELSRQIPPEFKYEFHAYRNQIGWNAVRGGALQEAAPYLPRGL